MGEPSPPRCKSTPVYSKERPPTQRTVRKSASDSEIEPLESPTSSALYDFIDSFYVTLLKYFHLVIVYDVFLYKLIVS